MKWIGLVPFSNIQVSNAAAIARTSNPSATRTPKHQLPKILASATRRFGRGHHECGERRQPPAPGFHETNSGAEVEGFPKAGLKHRRADPTRRISRPTSAKDVVLGELTSVVAMIGSLCGCQNAVNALLVNIRRFCAVLTGGKTFVDRLNLSLIS